MFKVGDMGKTILTLATIGFLFSDLRADVCKNDLISKTSCLDIGIDYICWKPCIDDMDFAAVLSGEISNEENPLQIKYRSITPPYDSGFRIYAYMPGQIGDFGIYVATTWLGMEHRNKIHAEENERIVLPLVHPQIELQSPVVDHMYRIAKGTWKMEYQTFEILGAFPTLYNCNIGMTALFGFEFLNLKQFIKSRGDEQQDQFSVKSKSEWQSHYTGVGLKVGADYRGLICNHWTFFLRGTSSLIGGFSDNRDKHSIEIQGGDVVFLTRDVFRTRDDEWCHIMPGFHIQMGVGWEQEICGANLHVRLGYEFVKWYQAYNSRRFLGLEEPLVSLSKRQIFSEERNFARSSGSDTTTFGFHGMLAGLEMRF
jgi:hypothetical protein